MDAHMLSRVVPLVVGALFLSAPGARATTYVVRPDGSGQFPTIQGAIDACVDGDIVELTDGTFTGDGNRDIDYLGKAIALRSRGGNPVPCIVDCGGSEIQPHRGVYFHSGEGPGSVLEGITFTGGHASDALTWGSGGGVFCNSASPTIKDCVFSGNWAEHQGGGIACCFSACPAITSCMFSTNRAGYSGGGIGCLGDCSPVVKTCVFSENSAVRFGGALSSHDGSFMTVTDCVLRGNSATGMSAQGGGMFCASSSTSISWCVFSGNSASSGAGMVCFHSDPMLAGCYFSDNVASVSGGAIFCLGSPEAVDCTFSGNSAEVRGGAISAHSASPSFTGCTFSLNGAPGGGSLSCRDASFSTIDNSIIAFSTEGGAVLCEGGAEMTLSCSDVYGNAGGDWVGGIAGQYGINGNISEDPRFCGPEHGDFTLHVDSPCAPGNSPAGCGLIGAWPVGCGTTTVEPATWGAIKGSFK